MGLARKNPAGQKRSKRQVHPSFRRDAGSETRFVQATIERKSPKLVAAAAVASLVAHILLFVGISVYATMPKPEPQPITVKIIPKPKPKPVVAEEKKEEIPPKPEKQPEKPKAPKEKKITSERKPKQDPVKPPPPVQGLSPDAVSPDGKGIAAPVGNTLMVADEGKRLKPEEVKPLGNEDLSSDPKLIRSSIETPTYTDAAIDAGLEGTFAVDVYVDASGAVTSADLPKKIGYGMDKKVMAAAEKARFEPRKDKMGRAVAGWTTISFRLELP